jgi:hypothetical protein
MTWKKINKNKLPDINKPVLVVTNLGRLLISWIDAGTMDFDDNDMKNDEKVTHWMPLPKRPK